MRRISSQRARTIAALRESIEALLRANEGASGFLLRPPPGLAAHIEQPIREGPGTVIGRYKLLEPIGEGGMGVVYMAEQMQPVRRKVALKVIKPGMDTRQVIARFEAERQALALMDHPNIARILDAGATESGRPYFVMELVRGDPDHRVLRPEPPHDRRPARPVRARLPGRPACPSEGNHPPRLEAVERA